MSTNTTADGIEALAIVRGLRERVRELESDKARTLAAINNALPAPEYLNDHDPIAVSTFRRIYRIMENNAPSPSPPAATSQ